MGMGKEHQELLFAFDKLPHQDYIQAKTPINKIKAETKCQFWHTHLGHQLDDAMTTASKYIDGVSKFPRHDPVLDACSTCIQDKQTKNAATGTTLKATIPFRGFSMDFSFAGISSKNLKRCHNYLGVHGETCWLLITNNFPEYIWGKAFKSKAVPL